MCFKLKSFPIFDEEGETLKIEVVEINIEIHVPIFLLIRLGHYVPIHPLLQFLWQHRLGNTQDIYITKSVLHIT